MNRDDILKMSRQENEGRYDEREMLALGKASKVGMAVGALLCVALVLLSEFVFDCPEVGLVGWMVYFSMEGSSKIVQYKELKKRGELVWGIIEIVFALAFFAALVIKRVV